MSLTPLFAFRLQPHHPIPPTPTNQDRIRAYRALAPIQLGNALFAERFKAREYERSEAADGRERYATGDHTP